MDKYTLQKDFKAEKTDTAGHIKRIRDEANEYRKTFNRLDNDIQITRRMVHQKTDDVEFQKTLKRLDEMPYKTDFKKLEQAVIPKV